MWNLVFLFTGLLFIILLLIIFLTKWRVKSRENKIFLVLSFLNLLGFVIEIILQIFVRKCGIDHFVITPLSKLYVIYIFVWFSIFSIYTFLISNSDGKISDDSYRMIKYLHITVMILGVIGIMIMPIDKYCSHGEMYSYGMAVSFLKIMLGIYIFVWIARLLFNFKTIKEKKYYSIIITILMLFINIIIQSINPTILIATFTMTYTCYIIFFTIENPDIKMAKDLAFSKEVAERFKNKTVETLNNLEDKLQGALDEMQKFGYKDIDTKDIDVVNKELKYMQNYCIDFVDEVSGLIDVSKIESGSEKIHEHEYDTLKLFDDIREIVKYNGNKKNTLVDVSKKTPEQLYGDDTSIKKMILYVYDYLCDVIDKDNLNIRIDTITVGNLCKLKFYFSTEKTMISNYIYDDDYVRSSRFEINNNNIKYMKIKRQEGVSNSQIELVNDHELLVSIKQRIIDPYVKVLDKEENKDIRVKYFDLSSKRILILDNNNRNIKELILLLRPYEIDIDVVRMIDDMRDKLSGNKTYDMVLVDSSVSDDILKYNINLLEKFVGYKFKSIIMLNQGKEKDREKYFKCGYDDYIIKPISKNNINDILIKYFKKDKAK